MKKRVLFLILFIVILITLVHMSIYAQTPIIRYVHNGATNNTSGTNKNSWNLATNDLQLAINESNDGDIIWIAKGTYLPSRLANIPQTWLDPIDPKGADLRDRAFVLKKGVKIYGGLDVGATNLNNRDFSLSGTILSGDFSNADVVTGNGETLTITHANENAYHVVIAVGDLGNAELNGLTIKGGHANGTGTLNLTQPGSSSMYGAFRSDGGGLYYRSSKENPSNLILNNITLTENMASLTGGAIYISTSKLTLNDCKIQNNIAYNAGGIINKEGSNLIISESILKGNKATNRGGAIVTNGNFLSGKSLDENYGRSFLTISNSILRENYAEKDAAGLWNNTGGLININNTYIVENIAGINGSGIKNIEASELNLRNVLIANNSTKEGGTYPGIYNRRGILTANNVTMVNNGDIGYNDVSVSIWKNSIIYDTRVAIKNSNDIGNDTEGLTTTFTATNVLEKSLEYPNITDIFTNPVQKDYTLKFNSPAINVGLKTLYAPSDVDTDKDLAKANRLSGNEIDLGAFEYQISTLDVNLIDFTSKVINNTPVINWQTLSEINNKQFILSRSSDGKNFIQLGKFSPKYTGNYSFVDNNAENGQNYYLLQQENIDGKISDIGLSILNFNLDKTTISFYPNPITDVCTLNFEAGKYKRLVISDITGKTLKTILISNTDSNLEIDISTYKAGIYLACLFGNYEVKSLKLIKN